MPDTMTVSRERQIFLQDVWTTAVEGGIGYWSQIEGYRWSDEDPSTMGGTLHELNDETDDFDGDQHVVTMGTITKGLGRIRRGEVTMNDRLRDAILLANRTNDAGEIDSDAADVIVQAGIFGEVVYG